MKLSTPSAFSCISYKALAVQLLRSAYDARSSRLAQKQWGANRSKGWTGWRRYPPCRNGASGKQPLCGQGCMRNFAIFNNVQSRIRSDRSIPVDATFGPCGDLRCESFTVPTTNFTICSLAGACPGALQKRRRSLGKLRGSHVSPVLIDSPCARRLNITLT
jgi:hypothetical protein